MSLDVKPGARFQSAVCDTQVAIVRTAESTVELCCGGQPMVPMGSDRGDAAPEAPFDAGTQMGKRYVTADDAVEVLVTKPGAGSLSVGDEALDLKEAKPLPASD